MCVAEIMLILRDIKYPLESSAEKEDKLVHNILQTCYRHLCSDVGVTPGLSYVSIRYILELM